LGNSISRQNELIRMKCTAMRAAAPNDPAMVCFVGGSISRQNSLIHMKFVAMRVAVPNDLYCGTFAVCFVSGLHFPAHMTQCAHT